MSIRKLFAVLALVVSIPLFAQADPAEALLAARNEAAAASAAEQAGSAALAREDAALQRAIDRKSDMIISGGVNIYPAEIESVLLTHPKVGDAAVFGIPHEDWGEEVKAVVEPAEGVEPGPALADELMAFCRERLARYKLPKTIDFVAELPRDPNGKLYKRKLRDPYWEGRERAI